MCGTPKSDAKTLGNKWSELAHLCRNQLNGGWTAGVGGSYRGKEVAVL